MMTELQDDEEWEQVLDDEEFDDDEDMYLF